MGKVIRWKWKLLTCLLGLASLLVIAGSSAAAPVNPAPTVAIPIHQVQQESDQTGISGAATSSLSVVGDEREKQIPLPAPEDSDELAPSSVDKTLPALSIGAQLGIESPEKRPSLITDSQATEVAKTYDAAPDNGQLQGPRLDGDKQEASDPLPASTSSSVISKAASSQPEPAPANRGSQETVTSEDQPSETVSKGSVAGTGQIEYTWQDGDRTLTVILQSDLEIDEGASTKDSMADSPSGAIVKSISPRSTVKSQPVFKSQSGALMTLPGGILLVLDAEWSQSEVNSFFSSNSIKLSEVEELDFVKNGYFVETEPGFTSLNLANTLAALEGVVLSSPNWWTEVTIK